MNSQLPTKSEAVQDFCTRLWDARAARALRPAEDLSRELATATAEDVARHRSYDPEADQRALWARAVIAALRVNPRRKPAADGDREAIAAWLLDRMPTPSGRALALADF